MVGNGGEKVEIKINFKFTQNLSPQKSSMVGNLPLANPVFNVILREQQIKEIQLKLYVEMKFLFTFQAHS